MPDGGVLHPEEIGTDALRAEHFATRLDGGVEIATALDAVLRKVIDDACKREGVTAAELAAAQYGHPSKWATRRGYALRTLTGVWATAPYLHNGSVPTLKELLTPASKRRKSFRVGSRELNVVEVGYGTDQGWEYDASQPGNSNSGHTGPNYGTELDESEKLALLEYLKSL
jgi:hypothetical protein